MIEPGSSGPAPPHPGWRIVPDGPDFRLPLGSTFLSFSRSESRVLRHQRGVVQRVLKLPQPVKYVAVIQLVALPANDACRVLVIAQAGRDQLVAPSRNSQPPRRQERQGNWPIWVDTNETAEASTNRLSCLSVKGSQSHIFGDLGVMAVQGVFGSGLSLPSSTPTRPFGCSRGQACSNGRTAERF